MGLSVGAPHATTQTKKDTNIRKAEPAPGAMPEGESKTARKSTTTESNQGKEKTLEYRVP